MMFILGIETSCDETAAAVVLNGHQVLSNLVASQAELHAQWGGVVPEAAARQHLERINPIIHQALVEAGVELNQIQGVAVTNRPGLVGALVVGLAAAKAIAMSLGVPLVGVNHLEGHLYSAFLESSAPVPFPHLCLIVSGGHTELVLARGHGEYERLGQTLDDAAGEAFDKSARLMELGYPGGPAVEQHARTGDPTAVCLPRAWLDGSLNFSFSGLKTAVRRAIEVESRQYSIPDICASLQQAVVDVLVGKALQAAEQTSVTLVTVVGGVAANSALQYQIRAAASEKGITVLIPPLKYCTDNASMIACAGHYRLNRGEQDDWDLDAYANEPLG